MHNNPKRILVNLGCKDFSLKKLWYVTELLLNPAE